MDDAIRNGLSKIVYFSSLCEINGRLVAINFAQIDEVYIVRYGAVRSEYNRILTLRLIPRFLFLFRSFMKLL